MIKDTGLALFNGSSGEAYSLRRRAEENERKCNYVDAKRLYFEAAQKYKEAASYARKYGSGVLGVSSSFSYKAKEMEMEYEYCMMQFKIVAQMQIGYNL